MAQLHCYVPDEVATRFQQKAKHAHLSVSTSQWPEGYFELFGSWKEAPLERPDQGNYEKREELE